MKNIQEKEVMLHKYETRHNKKELNELLDENFVEIGYSGKTFNYDETIKSLISEKRPDYDIHSQDYEYIKLSENIIQVIYLSAKVLENGVIEKYAKRMSIWEQNSDVWKMRYHQATPTNKFEIKY